jgi:HEAT repeat protein
MIKILVSMKGDAARILIEMLNDMISRVKIREISEDDWYYYRNILRVLREIHAADAIPCLEIMASWPEPRLRLEIVKTLEGMPAVKAEKLFVRLARDENPEVRKAAVVAIGLSGDSVMIPHLLEIFECIPECRAIAAASLGRIGGARARDHLIRLMEDASIYRRLEISKRDSEEIKATIIKALSLIGDDTAIGKVAEYSAKTPDKSLFRSDLLSNTAKIILGSKIR